MIKLTFKSSGKEYYFGSYAAIYEKFNSGEIGAVLGTVWNNARLTGGSYSNSKVNIERIEVHHKKRR